MNLKNNFFLETSQLHSSKNIKEIKENVKKKNKNIIIITRQTLMAIIIFHFR